MRSGWIAEATLWLLAAASFGASFLLGPPPVPAFAPGPRAPGSVRVVTWNVGGAEGGRPHGLRAEHVAGVALRLAELDPDLALLQEVGAERVADLRAALGERWQVLPGRGDVVALSPRHHLERWRHPRGPANVIGVRADVDGRAWCVLGLHASAYSSRERNAEIGAAAQALLAEPADVLLLAGDLNLDLDPEKRGDLFSDDQHLDVETYNFVARSLVDVARAAGPTAEPDRRLDYLLVSPGVRALAAGPWKGRRLDTMDHDPVVADLDPR